MQRIELSKVQELVGNPKLHELSEIRKSLQRFGFINPLIVNTTTEHLLGGHGRVYALNEMKSTGDIPPLEVEISEVGDWLVPVFYVSLDPENEKAASLALNQLTISSGFDEEALARFIEAMLEEGGVGSGNPDEVDEALIGTGFNDRNLQDLLMQLAVQPFGEEDQGNSPSGNVVKYEISILVDNPDDKDKAKGVLESLGFEPIIRTHRS